MESAILGTVAAFAVLVTGRVSLALLFMFVGVVFLSLTEVVVDALSAGEGAVIGAAAIFAVFMPYFVIPSIPAIALGLMAGWAINNLRDVE